MPEPFESLRLHVTDEKGPAAMAAVAPETPFHSDEAAARYYADRAFAGDGRPALVSLRAPRRPERVPELRCLGVEEQPLTGTRLVRFEQTRSAVPVFGCRVLVELAGERRLMSLDAEVAEVPEVSPLASLCAADALVAIADAAVGEVGDLSGVEAPRLVYFHHEGDDSWHLAYHFRRVPAAPAEFVERLERSDEAAPHRLEMSHALHRLTLELDYLVDAHDGALLFYYSSHPLLEVPTRCRGVDEHEEERQFWGRRVNDGGEDGAFEMRDPLRVLTTYDLELGDILRAQFPEEPVRNDSSDWEESNRAAVSAHVHAMQVFDFYQSELKRDGVDGRGMELVSVVNCTLAQDGPGPEWFNAAWWRGRMWYGQIRRDGRLRSLSSYLDIIAHELTHGVTESTSDLVYADQSGALNESFSDIFGVIISNGYRLGLEADVGEWDWEIGPDLAGPGLPLRNLADPGSLGHPDHMDRYLVTDLDNGGVHTNSNIHNKAAFNLLTSTEPPAEAGGEPEGDVEVEAEGEAAAPGRVFTPREVAVLYYLTLIRLPANAEFVKALQVLVDVAATLYAGDPAERERKVAAIRRAYEAVGIVG